jgi:hypothetical protein
VRADHDDLRAIPWNFRLDIVARLSAHVVAVSSGPQPSSRKRTFDEIGSGIELCVMPHVALADFSRELLHIRAELFAQHNFIRRQRPRLGNILPRHPHSKPPE